MDATAWVSVAGLVTTLAAALLTPLLAERMRRESARREQLGTARLETYAELLRVTDRLVGNAKTWSAIPLADLEEIDNAELERLVARLRVVASDGVYKRLDQIISLAGQFNRALADAKSTHQALRDAGSAADSTATHQRVQLAGIADSLSEVHKELETVIRKEIGR